MELPDSEKITNLCFDTIRASDRRTATA